MQLYEYPISGNSHKVRMLLSFLGVEYESRTVDLRAGEHREAWFLELNPRGQVPVLEDGEVVLWDSQAILVYIARSRGSGTWLPNEPAAMGRVLQWMALAGQEIQQGLMICRQIHHFGWEDAGDPERARHAGERALKVLEDRLEHRRWLVGNRPTIADLSCFPYVGLAGQAEFSLDEYPGVRRWVERVKSLEGYVAMEGL